MSNSEMNRITEIKYFEYCRNVFNAANKLLQINGQIKKLVKQYSTPESKRPFQGISFWKVLKSKPAVPTVMANDRIETSPG